MTEHTITLELFRRRRGRTTVRGVAVGTIVYSHGGRAMRVLRNDEYVVMSDHARGPYCALQALDDKQCVVIWPRRWYTLAGEQIPLDLELPIEEHR